MQLSNAVCIIIFKSSLYVVYMFANSLFTRLNPDLKQTKYLTCQKEKTAYYKNTKFHTYLY